MRREAAYRLYRRARIAAGAARKAMWLCADFRGDLALGTRGGWTKPLPPQVFARWTNPQNWIEVSTLVDVAHHVEEADHVLKQIAPDREVD